MHAGNHTTCTSTSLLLITTQLALHLQASVAPDMHPPGTDIRNSANVTYRLLLCTPANGLLPASAMAGASVSRYRAKLAAKGDHEGDVCFC
jgi:hypothetical protein